MRFNQRQHLKMASVLDSRSEMNPDPVKARKQLAMANVFHVLAQKAGAEERRRVAQLPIRPMTDEPGVRHLDT